MPFSKSPLKSVVIGIGNDLRHDDAIGLYVVRIIEEHSIPEVKTVIGVKDGTALINAWEGFNNVYIVDAIQSKDTPGKIYRFDALTEEIPEHTFSSHSTHVFNLSSTVKLAESLQQLPDKLIIFGIVGKNFSHGRGLTNEVKTGGDEVVKNILSELSA